MEQRYATHDIINMKGVETKKAPMHFTLDPFPLATVFGEALIDIR